MTWEFRRSTRFADSIHIIKKLLQHADIDIYYRNEFDNETKQNPIYNKDIFIWQIMTPMPDELLILIKKRAPKQFRNSQLKKLWEKKFELFPGMVELHIAPFLLPKIPGPEIIDSDEFDFDPEFDGSEDEKGASAASAKPKKRGRPRKKQKASDQQ